MVHDLPELGVEPTMVRLPDALLPEVTRRLAQRLQAQIEAWGRKFVGQTLALGPTGTRTVKAVCLIEPHLPWGRLFEIRLTPQVDLG